MRVLQLNIHYRGTGADRCARELYEDLPLAGVETAMWVSNRNPGDPPEIRALQYSWERLLLPMEAVPHLTDWRHRGAIQHLGSVSARDFDVVHFHNIHSGAFSIRAVRELAARLPSVWTLHDEWAPSLGLTYNLTGRLSPAETKQISRGMIRHIPYNRYHENPKWRVTRRFLQSHLPQPGAVVCPSRYMADLARTSKTFSCANILHIPNGTRLPQLAETRMDRRALKNRLGLDPGKQVVLMASVDLAQAHKGTDFAISSIHALRNRENVQVLLLGGSADRVRNSLAPIPTVAMSASNDRLLASAYRASDVCVIPSLADNFPYVALESLACETPVVTFPVGGLPEIVGRNERGIVCSRIDTAEMSSNIAMLLSDLLLRENLGRAGAKWVSTVCSMQAYLNNIKSVYEQVIESARGVSSPTSVFAEMDAGRGRAQ